MTRPHVPAVPPGRLPPAPETPAVPLRECPPHCAAAACMHRQLHVVIVPMSPVTLQKQQIFEVL